VPTSRGAKSCLQTPLLVMKEENNQKKIKVNFEKDIQKLIREAKALDREGIEDIPESAKIILLQEEKFKNYYYELDFVKNEYDRIIGMIKPVMKNILAPHIEDLDLKMRPGMVTLTWTSMNIDGFLQLIQMSLSKLEQLIITINDIIDNRIENNLKTIGKVVLVKLPEDGKPMSLDGFVDSQSKHIAEKANLLISKNIEIERAVDDLLDTVMKYPLDSDLTEGVDQKATQKIKGYYFWYLYQALLNSTQNSLTAMKNRICEKRVGNSNEESKQKLKPFFEVDIKLENRKVTLSPTLEDIQKAVNKAATAILGCSKQLVRWGQLGTKSSDFHEDKDTFYSIVAQDKEIVKVILLLTGSFKGTKNLVDAFKLEFEDYKSLWDNNITETLKAFSESNPKLQDFENALKGFADFDRRIDSIKPNKNIGAMTFKTDHLIQGLKDKCKDWKTHYSRDLHNKARTELNEVTEYLRNLQSKLNKEVVDIKSLGMVMQTLEETRKEQAVIDLRFGPILDMYNLLDQHLQNVSTDKEEVDNRALLKKRWKELVELCDQKQSELQQEQAIHLKKLKSDQKKLLGDVKVFRKNFLENGPMAPGISPKEASDRLAIESETYELKKALYDSNKRGEDLFGLQNLQYPELVETKNDISFLAELYNLYNKVNEVTNSWEEEVWDEIEVAHIKDWEEKISEFSTACSSLPKGLREWQAFKDLKEKIDKYKNILPFVIDLKDRAFEERHWKALCERTKKTLNYKNPENFYFKELINADLLAFQEDLEEAITTAKKQKSMLKTFGEITTRWDAYEFKFKKWGKTNVSILMGDCIANIKEDLENDGAQLNGLYGNKYIGDFKDQIFAWINTLGAIDKTIGLWVKVQILWTALEAVFTSGDIAKHLKTEAKKFKKINKDWKKNVMDKAVEQIKVKICCQNDIIKTTLPTLQIELEGCQKELDKYLEQKRRSFPRFYFVSDPVLLKFLSQGSEPENIQDELDKLFDAVSKATFVKQPKATEKMITQIMETKGDHDKEVIELDNPVPCIGNIEDWLKELEKSMQQTVKTLIQRVNQIIREKLDMTRFVKERTAQIALIGLQMRWTKIIQESLEDRIAKLKGIENAKTEIAEIQRFLTNLCKTDIKSKLERMKLETLVLIVVYLEQKTRVDIVPKLSPNGYDWLKYTRIYWRDDINHCVVSITDWNTSYSYEYLGTKERLCITPLTDRCYITMAQAMSMNYGGSPVGPAGTGKTETVKDLSRTLGIFVIVTNCSPEHRSRDMAKIFKGLCQSGLWGCFDEFNRIISQVLSVIAMQVESITTAKKRNHKELIFPGETEKCPMVKTCGYFITMNPPSYGGRQKLPENLKVLFRGISMMVPNRENIIQVKLASAGYTKYTELAKKFHVLYGLCEEQLSKQRHYDFGLRNILSVLRTAGDSLREDDIELKKKAAEKGEEPKLPDENFLMMRTLRDMNLSKLVAQDVPLFEALLNDTFRIDGAIPQKIYEEEEKLINKRIEENILINHPDWYRKIIQVLETSKVRHGFMVIGPVGSGKSAILTVLSEALSLRSKTVMIKLNPKSFTSQEMYGCNDFSGDWTPGVFSEIWEAANKKENKNFTWITCDGPVDAIWIESLNTVLDDNKVLTLANGGRIFMKDTVKMVFEAENLNNASAATVSRCGQIYVSDTDLGYIPVMEGWVKQRIEEKKNQGNTDDVGNKKVVTKLFSVAEGAIISKLFKKYFIDHDVINNVEKIGAKNPIMKLFPILRMTMTLNLFNGILAPLMSGKTSKRLVEADYNRILIFCIIWGTSGVYEPKERAEIQEWFKDKQYDIPKIKDNETIYDYELDLEGDNVQWKRIEPGEWKPNSKKIEFSQILMPTIDASRAAVLMKYIAHQEYSSISRRSSLIIGGPGTAKTSSILMYAGTFKEDMILHRINFSSATQPQHFQTSIESVCEQKIQRGFGPKDMKQMTCFIDDFSMPELNATNDQVTLEIVRQLIEDHGFYMLEKIERGNFKYIENLRYVAAMNHPGGGRNDIPNRIKRQFFIFNMTLPERIDLIFNPILKSVFKEKEFSDDVNKVVDNLSDATIKLWKRIKNRLLPTPTKFHYIFNLRDVSKIFKGICCTSPESIKNVAIFNKGEMKPEIYMIALWRNECERVFVDKLIDNSEKTEIIRYITECSHENFSNFSKDIEDKIDSKRIMFCSFLRKVELDENDDFLEKPVRTVEGTSDIERLKKQAELYLRVHNKKVQQKAMDLVLFDDALGHLLRICRLLEQKRSSALLVGVGGSGKQSLTRLGSFIGDQKLKQIVLVKGFNDTSLKDFLKQLYIEAGQKNWGVTFILTDAEIKKEDHLEYINMILSTGEVPGVLAKDEKELILAELKMEIQKRTKREPSSQETYEYFINRLRDNLHLVLCFSPVGMKFRERARKFPALFNECTIDWYLPWPKEALFNVAKQQIDNFDDLKTKKETREKDFPEWMSKVHTQVVEACDMYFAQMRKQVFVTPKSYLFFLKSYKVLYSKEMEKLVDAERNYTNGLAKIKEAKAKIDILDKDLKEKQVEIEAKQKLLNEVLDKIKIRTIEAEKKEREVKSDKERIEKEATLIKKKKDECEADLNKELPKLQAAKEAAEGINAQDISQWKNAIKNDPFWTTKYMVEAMSILLFQKVRCDIDPVQLAPTKKTVQTYTLMRDSWSMAKSVLMNSALKSQLLSRADKNNAGLINDEILELLAPYTNLKNTFFEDANIINNCSADLKLKQFIVGIEAFSNSTRVIKPKQAALDLEQEKLDRAFSDLRKAEETLKQIMETLAKLDEEKREKKEAAETLENQARDMERKIKKATKLITSLSTENDRWKTGSEEISMLKTELIGNVGLATAFISYCGPFNTIYRDQIANERFMKDLTDLKIPFSPTIYNKLVEFLVDEATTGQWNLDGLPKDTLSIQNGIMVESSERYPLLIDPQGQGAFWIKNKYKGLNKEGNRPRVTIVNPTEERKMKDALRYCIEGGEIFILEGIVSEVDPMLDPVLEKQYIRSQNARAVKINLGDDTLVVDPAFKVFITCKLGNPRFTPELSAKTTIIDFTVTQIGLEQQLLSVVLSKEQSVLEESLNQLLKKVTQRKKTLQDLDRQLLAKLNESDGNLLENDELLDILNNTKTESKDIQAQLIEADIKTKDINLKREIYRPVAIRGAALYFCMIEIANINWMYNSSLNQFLGLYNSSIEDSKDGNNLQGKKRVEEIEKYLTYEVFEYVNRGLFSSHKVTFLLMTCFKIMVTAKEMTESDITLFLTVGSNLDKANMKPKPSYKWLDESTWINILDLSNHKFNDQGTCFFKGLPDSFINNPEDWEKWFSRNDPEAMDIPEFHDNIKNDKNGNFLWLTLIRSLKPDRTIICSNTYVVKILQDQRYVETPSEDCGAYFAKSSPKEPILYLLSDGADPTSNIQAFYLNKLKKILTCISLGEGQAEKAEALIKEYMPLGNSVLLQNSHLGLDFMEYIDNKLSDPEYMAGAHPDFRIWMSCEPTPEFPLGLLQKSLKVTNEPPKGLKAGLRRTFKQIVVPELLEKLEHPTWRILCYTLSFLHSLVQERRKFGSLGWCITYEFNDSDLEACLAYVEKYLTSLMLIQGTNGAPNQSISIDYNVINIMVCEIQYGGKISDNIDRELFRAYGDKYFKSQITNPDFPLADVKDGFQYKIPRGQEHSAFLAEIDRVPITDSPEVFQLSVYADIACRMKETKELMESLTDTRPKEGGNMGGGPSKEEQVQVICKKRLAQITNYYPQHVIVEHVSKLKGPRGYPSGENDKGFSVPLNIFLSQELQRMDKITLIIKKSMTDICEAVDGQILMTPMIVDQIDCLYNNKVPKEWLYDPAKAQISWMKLKFSVWFDSFKTRNITLEDWMKGSRPRAFNLDHYFNPQGLLTSMKQEVVRIKKQPSKTGGKPTDKIENWSMDNVADSFEVLTERKIKENENKREPDKGGIWITGLWLEGCRWKEGLAEANEKTLIYPMPMIEMTAVIAEQTKDGKVEDTNEYRCPMYKYPMRTDEYLITRVPLKCAGAQGKDSNVASFQLKGTALTAHAER
jgi:dynein heavy chain